MNGQNLVKQLVGPVEKLIDVVSKGIGTLYEPKKIRKKAIANAEAFRTINDAIKDSNTEGSITYKDENFSINYINNEEIKNIVTSEVERLIKERDNILKIADIAYDELENSKKEIKESIDDDWQANFFEKGRKIYREDLQFIFGKILAGEIKQPGTFSKRLLNILSSISQTEAETFNTIASLVLKNQKGKCFIVSDEEILKKFSIDIEKIIGLEEAGLINTELLTINGYAYEYGSYLIKFKNETKLHIYMLTSSGCELMNIINQTFYEDYINAIQEKYNLQDLEKKIIIAKEKKENYVNYKLLEVNVEMKNN